uniref:NtA domain-containing protein n=1 Tax=Strongyloides stercoralis TaxID=6248 RepID=A0A913HNC0_STRER
MNFSTFNYLFLLFSFIHVCFSCAPFNCRGYSNDVTIAFTIKPRLSITYNTIKKNRRRDQHASPKALGRFLKSIIDGAVAHLRNKHRVNPHMLLVGTNLNHKKSKLLEVNLVDDDCVYDCNYEHTYAPAGSYLIKNTLLERRVENSTCLNGKIVHNKSEPVTTLIVFNVSVRPADRRVFCMTHWNIFARTVKARMIRGYRGEFVGDYVIQRQ